VGENLLPPLACGAREEDEEEKEEEEGGKM
jgi:hypothetical protein